MPRVAKAGELGFLVASLMAAVLPHAAAAQVRITGHAVDSTAGPIGLVEVITDQSTVLTGPRGRFAVIATATNDSLSVSFRRVGYRPRLLKIGTEGLGAELDLGAVVLEPIPIRLDDIRVEALAPILPQRAIREFEFARREGVSRHFFTAYDIERLRPFSIDGITRRVPGARTVNSVQFGQAIEMSSRGRNCTATIVLDGVATRNTDPETMVSLERIGAMWYTPVNCTVHIWTKSILIEEASPFELGLRVVGMDGGNEWGVAGFGGYMLVPLVGRLILYPAFTGSVGRNPVRWHVQLAARFGIRADEPDVYLAGGWRSRRFDSPLAQGATGVPVVMVGVGTGVGIVRGFVELTVVSPVTGNERRTEITFGIGVRH